MRASKKWLHRKVPGQGLVEYSLILVLTTLAMIVLVTLTTDKIDNMYSYIGSAIHVIVP